MKFQKQIDFLLDNACTSIKFLVHRDFLHTPFSEPFMQKMRDEILEQENIPDKTIFIFKFKKSPRYDLEMEKEC